MCSQSTVAARPTMLSLRMFPFFGQQVLEHISRTNHDGTCSLLEDQAKQPCSDPPIGKEISLRGQLAAALRGKLAASLCPFTSATAMEVTATQVACWAGGGGAFAHVSLSFLLYLNGATHNFASWFIQQPSTKALRLVL